MERVCHVYVLIFLSAQKRRVSSSAKKTEEAAKKGAKKGKNKRKFGPGEGRSENSPSWVEDVHNHEDGEEGDETDRRSRSVRMSEIFPRMENDGKPTAPVFYLSRKVMSIPISQAHEESAINLFKLFFNS